LISDPFFLAHIFLCNGFLDDKLDQRAQTRVSVMAITGPEAWATNVQYAFMVAFVLFFAFININIFSETRPESRNYG
jgi:hypothetical protein